MHADEVREFQFRGASTSLADEKFIIVNGVLIRITGENIKVEVKDVEVVGKTPSTNPPKQEPPKADPTIKTKVKTLTDGMPDPNVKIVLIAVLRTAKSEAQLKRELGRLLPKTWAPWSKGIAEIIDGLKRRGQFTGEEEVSKAFNAMADGVEELMKGQSLLAAIKWVQILPIIIKVFEGEKISLQDIMAILLPLLQNVGS